MTLKCKAVRNLHWEKQKHYSIQDSIKVWYSTLPQMYLVIYENRYKVHSLLSGTFERSGSKMFWRIIFACGGSKSSKGLLTQEQLTQVNILAGRDLQIQSPESCLGKHCNALLTWAWNFSAFWARMASTTSRKASYPVLLQLCWSQIWQWSRAVISVIKECTHSMLIRTDMNISSDVKRSQ